MRRAWRRALGRGGDGYESRWSTPVCFPAELANEPLVCCGLAVKLFIFDGSVGVRVHEGERGKVGWGSVAWTWG